MPGPELSLLTELTGQLCGSIRTGPRIGQDISADAEQLIQQRPWKAALENGSWEQIEDLQGSRPKLRRMVPASNPGDCSRR